MPGKHYAGGCNCCDPCHVQVACRFVTDTTIEFVVANATGAVVNEYSISGVTTHTLTPPNGTHTMTFTAGHVYELIAEDNTVPCERRCTLGARCACDRIGIISTSGTGLPPYTPVYYVKVVLIHTPGASGNINLSGTYWATFYTDTCCWLVYSARTPVYGGFAQATGDFNFGTCNTNATLIKPSFSLVGGASGMVNASPNYLCNATSGPFIYNPDAFQTFEFITVETF